MNLNQLDAISDAIEVIAERTETDRQEIIDALTGCCWDEEDAGELKFYATGLD